VFFETKVSWDFKKKKWRKTEIRKVTLSLGLLSPPNPSFTGTRKVGDSL
jgi:hypothetical protein